MKASLRRLFLGSALAFVHHLAVAQYVMCGLGPPPGSAGYAEWDAKIEEQRQRLGYLLVCDRNLDRYRFEDEVANDTAVKKKLAFKPRELDGSAFGKLQFLGSIADGFGDAGAAMYRRVFRDTDGAVITLQEFVLAKGAAVRSARQDGLLKLRGTDAQLTVVQAASGKGFTELAWQEDSTYLEVTVGRGLDNGRSRQRLISLAESLPRRR